MQRKHTGSWNGQNRSAWGFWSKMVLDLRCGTQEYIRRMGYGWAVDVVLYYIILYYSISSSCDMDSETCCFEKSFATQIDSSSLCILLIAHCSYSRKPSNNGFIDYTNIGYTSIYIYENPNRKTHIWLGNSAWYQCVYKFVYITSRISIWKRDFSFSWPIIIDTIYVHVVSYKVIPYYYYITIIIHICIHDFIIIRMRSMISCDCMQSKVPGHSNITHNNKWISIFLRNMWLYIVYTIVAKPVVFPVFGSCRVRH